MDWQKKIRLPDWLPPELKKHAKAHRQLKPQPSWEGEVLSNWISTTNVLMNMEERLVTYPEMREVWFLFQKHRKNDRMVYFLTKSIMLYADAMDKYLPGGQKQEKRRIKNLKSTIRNRVEKFSEIIIEVEKFRGLHEKAAPLLQKLTEIEESLTSQLDFSWRWAPPRVQSFGRPVQAIESTENFGSHTYVETVLKKGIPELFVEIFNEPHARLARIVSLVMLGKAVPKGKKGDADLLRNQIYDSIKGSRRPRKAK